MFPAKISFAGLCFVYLEQVLGKLIYTLNQISGVYDYNTPVRVATMLSF